MTWFNARNWLPFLLVLSLPLYQNCKSQDGTDTGEPGLTLQLSSYEQSTALFNYFVPKAFAEVSGVAMCIHQVRFKKDNSSNSPGENINIELGRVDWNPAGTTLTSLDVSPGDYRRLDIMLRDDCQESFSLVIQNTNGEFVVENPIILRFENEFTVDGLPGELVLDVSPFIDFFDGVSSSAELETGVSNISGGIEEN